MITDIFIDLDGPILEGRRRHYQCYRDILLNSGESLVLPLDDYWALKRSRTDISEILAATDARIGRDDFHEQWLKKIEAPEYITLDQLKPGAKETLEKWARERRVHLATCRQFENVLLEQLEHLEILRLFSRVLCCGISERSLVKYRRIRALEYSRAVFIGDTEMDMESAARLGLPALAITTGLRDRALLQADHYFEEIRDIPDSLLD